MIFEIDNVELYFKAKRILQGIYLKGETGQVTAILGRNGCGKTCLMDIIFGDLKPKYGLIRLDGKPLSKALYKTQEAKYLSQDHFVLGQLKLRIALKLFGLNWSDLITWAPEFEVHKKSRFNKLSGGEKRIFEVCIILKSKAKIVLLDEPFNGISPLMIERVKSLINEEKKEKIIILSDHRYKDVIESADRIYLLKNGSTTAIHDLKLLEDYQYLSQGSLPT